MIKIKDDQMLHISMADIRRVLKSKELQRKIKENMYKTVIKPVAIYGSKLYQLNTKKREML